ncbi:MAG: hypothetical protein AB1589_22025 [Cyanobacteriota bacterium]
MNNPPSSHRVILVLERSGYLVFWRFGLALDKTKVEGGCAAIASCTALQVIAPKEQRYHAIAPQRGCCVIKL